MYIYIYIQLRFATFRHRAWPLNSLNSTRVVSYVALPPLPPHSLSLSFSRSSLFLPLSFLFLFMLCSLCKFNVFLNAFCVEFYLPSLLFSGFGHLFDSTFASFWPLWAIFGALGILFGPLWAPKLNKQEQMILSGRFFVVKKTCLF